METLLRFIGIDRLLAAVLARFNLVYLLRAVLALLERLADKRVDNETLHEVVFAAACRAETLHPEGHGYEKYKLVTAAAIAEGQAWLTEYAREGVEAFESWIDDEIQLAHAEMSKLIKEQGSAILGSLSANLDRYPNAAAQVRR